MRSCRLLTLKLNKMEDFKQEFINVAYSEFGIKAIESINFEQAFAILDKMQQLRIHDVVGRSEQLVCEECKELMIEPYAERYGKKFCLGSM